MSEEQVAEQVAENAPQEEKQKEEIVEESKNEEEGGNPFEDADPGDVEKGGDGTPTKPEEKRKSLVGLSPSQDAKVIMFKQMFQDYDEEVLCSILFEQNGGNLDASIESILKMQSADNEEGKKEEKPKEEGSSLADDPNADKSGAPNDENTEKSKGDVDKQTQELIDELLAEDQQAILQEQEEEAQVLAAQLQATEIQ